jgi:ABC-type branched-subunit amino acid transport system ATPase component
MACFSENATRFARRNLRTSSLYNLSPPFHTQYHIKHNLSMGKTVTLMGIFGTGKRSMISAFTGIEREDLIGT